MARFFLFVSIAILASGCTRTKPTLKDVENPSAQLLVQSCYGCHNQSNIHNPSINGLTESELDERLRLYKSDPKGQSVMNRLMQGYSKKEISVIAKTLGQDE